MRRRTRLSTALVKVNTQPTVSRPRGYGGGIRDVLYDNEAQRTLRAELKASALQARG
ncbi:MAG: hypothetical protein ACREX3_00300 [Gammaproteobacteria bacterium]